MNEFKSVLNEVRKLLTAKDRKLLLQCLLARKRQYSYRGYTGRRRQNHYGSCFSKALGLKYGRIQFTPDTLPSDITGFSSFNKESGKCI